MANKFKKSLKVNENEKKRNPKEIKSPEKVNNGPGSKKDPFTSPFAADELLLNQEALHEERKRFKGSRISKKGKEPER